MDHSTSEGGIKCPAGKVPCNPQADPTHVYCVDPAIFASNKCPITDIKFIEANEVSAYKSDGYKVLNFGNQKLAFSKTTNNKPLTTLKMSTSEPCLNPYEQPYNEDRRLMAGEFGGSPKN